MKYFFSFLERKSFLKTFFICLTSLIFLTGFAYSDEDRNSWNLESIPEEENNIIRIFPPKRVTVIYAGEKIDLLTYEKNVREVLQNHNFSYSDYDIILPSLDYEIKDKSLIRIVLIEKELITTREEVPFKTTRTQDSSLDYGIEKVIQSGLMGIKEITYEGIYENNELIEKRIYREEVLREPIDKVIALGTKTSAMGGRNCPHWFEIVDRATEDEWERETLKSLIRCESHCNDAKNNSNRYLGLLQFNRNTFEHYGGKDIWDGEQQILSALNILRAGGLSHHWPACSQNTY